MDGMDGRGQVIIIGATNRPDSIDPALRRPGRFDREFYFPLPNLEGRRAILDIHTKGWNPPLDPAIKDELAKITKGYGGADLRALCTEAALNAVQRRYPQIYQSKEKLLIDPKTIEVIPKDFMISVKKMIPSSQRSASSAASPLPASVEPLLRKSLAEIQAVLAEILPQKKKTTALEEAQYEEITDARGFGKEKMQQAFETSRVFRPRLLIQGKPGMGQQYLAAAVLNHFEGLHVQSFDLPTLHGDTASTPEATMIRLFSEVKMHSPSVIYLPNVQEWYRTLGHAAYTTFLGLLRSVKATDLILLLGVAEADKDHFDDDMRRDLFGYSNKCRFELDMPRKDQRYEFFAPVMRYIEQTPDQFPDPTNRKKRVLERLVPAPPEPEKPPAPLTKAEVKAQKKRDRQTLNALKIRLQPIMDQIRTKYKKFRAGVIDENQIRYLFDEADPGTVSSDLHTEMLARASFRPFEVGRDAHGEPGLVDQANDKFYYNIDTVTIERRLSNGYYKRPKDFLADVKRLAKDAKTIGDEDRLLKANELLANVEVDIGAIEMETAFVAECERVYQRELVREKEVQEKARRAAESNQEMPPPQIISNVPHGGASDLSASTVSSGPIVLGEPIVNGRSFFPRMMPRTPSKAPSNSTVLTNGIAHGQEINGSTSHNGGHEADVEGDTPMGGTESHPNSHERLNETQKTHTTSSFGQSAQPRPPHSYTAPSQQMRKESGMSGPLSQTGGITPMAPGSQAADYQNDASTTQTTSGRKDSGPSPEQHQPLGTQELGPNLYLYNERRSAGGSEIPDTQGTNKKPHHGSDGRSVPMSVLTDETENLPISQLSAVGVPSTPSQSQMSARPHFSQDQGGASQSQPPVPAFAAAPRRSIGGADIQALLNPTEATHLVSVEKGLLENFHRDLTDKTSGLSVEQLEQVNSVLMDVLWKTRGDWDRRAVMDRVLEGFHEVVKDMQDAGQDFEESSWGIRGRG
jgi:ATPase family AAA domain-containing protein 2